MVRAGVVKHPLSWEYSGFYEVQQSPKRYRLIDLPALLALCGFSNQADLHLRRYKDGLWAEYCRVPAGNLVRLPRDADVNEMCKVSQINVGYRALKRARLHSGEIVLVNGFRDHRH